MPYSRNKQKLTVTIDNDVIDAIEKIKATMKYPNRSAATNELLLKGLSANGITLES
jgi:metal-responsive CopG/Arc/MetJ family transcriptional regulator